MTRPPYEDADAISVGAAHDYLGDLRAKFEKRLLADRRRFVTLRAVIAHGPTIATRTLDELCFLSHRMSGAAAIFDQPLLAAAARTMSDEAKAAQAGGAARTGTQAWLALDALIDILSRVDRVRRRKACGPRDLPCPAPVKPQGHAA